MTGRAGKAARKRQAGRIRAVLEQIDAGTINVHGAGHSLAQTRQRLERKLAELEGGHR